MWGHLARKPASVASRLGSDYAVFPGAVAAGPQSHVQGRRTWHQTLTRRPVSPRLPRGLPRPRHSVSPSRGGQFWLRGAGGCFPAAATPAPRRCPRSLSLRPCSACALKETQPPCLRNGEWQGLEVDERLSGRFIVLSLWGR